MNGAREQTLQSATPVDAHHEWCPGTKENNDVSVQSNSRKVELSSEEGDPRVKVDGAQQFETDATDEDSIGNRWVPEEEEEISDDEVNGNTWDAPDPYLQAYSATMDSITGRNEDMGNRGNRKSKSGNANGNVKGKGTPRSSKGMLPPDDPYWQFGMPVEYWGLSVGKAGQFGENASEAKTGGGGGRSSKGRSGASQKTGRNNDPNARKKKRRRRRKGRSEGSEEGGSSQGNPPSAE